MKSKLTKHVSGSFSIKIVSTALLFLTSISLARALGSKYYGIYTFINTWLFFLQFLSSLGFRQLIVREVALYKNENRWGLVKGLLLLADKMVISSSIVIFLSGSFVVWLNRAELSQTTVLAFWIALSALPFISLIPIRQSILQGLNYVILGQLPESIIQPLVFLLILLITLIFGSGLGLIPVMFFRLISFGISFFAVILILQGKVKHDLSGIPPSYNSKVWLMSLFPFMLMTGNSLLHVKADILMLGMLSGSQDVGIYNIASKSADFLGFILFAVNSSVAPLIPRLYSSGDIRGLRKTISKSVLLASSIALCIAFLLIITRKQFLLIFGQEYIAGQYILIVLVLGQLFNVISGPPGILLSMTGNASDVALSSALGALTNIGLNFILIPKWGMMGASIATASGIAVWNIMMIVIAYRKIRVVTFLFGNLIYYL